MPTQHYSEIFSQPTIINIYKFLRIIKLQTQNLTRVEFEHEEIILRIYNAKF